MNNLILPCSKCKNKLHRSKLTYFKGNYYCGKCKKSAGHILSAYRPDLVLKPHEGDDALIRGPGRPRGSHNTKCDKPMLKGLTPLTDKDFSTSLKNEEAKVLWFSKSHKGIQSDIIKEDIQTLKETVKSSHKLNKAVLKANKPSFKEHFEVLRGAK